MPNDSANINCLETYWVSIKRSSQGLLDIIEYVEIVKELIKIGLNKVCDIFKYYVIMFRLLAPGSKRNHVIW